MSKILSPCIGVCEIDPKNNLCMGCFRSAQEIENWSYYEDKKKEEILILLERRKK